MEHISLLFQGVVAVSVLIVWVFRYHNVITEFQQFGYSDVFRNFVGASKIAISTLAKEVQQLLRFVIIISSHIYKESLSSLSGRAFCYIGLHDGI